MSMTATGVVDSISHTKLDQDSMIHTKTGKADVRRERYHIVCQRGLRDN